MMTKICIIVPVYNTEEYLRRCIDSILSQTYTDFELILIDDGSTDNSGEICDEYAVMDKRIVVIHQENRGQANARNVGLDYAFEKSKSEWISFVDSDDFIHSQMLQLLYQKINNTGSKVIVGDYLEFSDEKMLNSSTQVSLNLVDLAIEQPEDFFVNSCYLETVPWGKLYHKSCFCNIRYPEGKIHEDNFTTYKIIFSLDKILHVKAEVYYYFSNYKGTTKSIWTPKRLDALEAYSEQISFFDKNGYKRAKNKIIYNYANVLFNQINSIKNQKQYRQYLKQMKKMMRKHLETYKGASIISFKNHHEYYDVAYPKFILRLFGYKFYNKPLSIKSRIRKLGISSQGKILPLGKLYYQYKIKKILREKKDFAEENYPIDFVVTWVDDNDVTWKAEKEKFLCTSDNLTKKDNTNIRYRNWETLRFWFRAVEKFAPWVNKVYFISCGHVPEWLNTDCKKIQVVKHDEYIPKEYLPTFSSHTIENNIWRISDLSEHFVYFNDDIFLTRSVVPSDFFQGGFPKYCAVTKPIRANNHMCSFDHALWNGLGEIISTVSIRDVMHKHPEKWLSVKLKDYYENNKKHVSNMRALLRQHLKKYHNEQGIKHNLQYYSYAYPIMTKFIRIAGFSKRILKRLIYPKSERIGLLGKIYFYHNIKKNLKQFKQTPDIDDFPVDFVVSWVNGNDPEWIQEKREYEIALDNDKKTANPTARYRDWNMFHYWFRAVEKNAPWVRNVYLLTWGHVPEWLETSHPKLKIIRHSEFIPAEYLPTFSSHTIELNMWRIEELSEHFVYFNDDMLLTAPVKKSDFFTKGLPKYCPLTRPKYTFNDMTVFEYVLMNNTGLFNSDIDFREIIKKHPEKWIYPFNSTISKYNMRTFKDGYLSGMRFTHVCMPYRKSSMIKCAERFSKKINETSRNKFRTYRDVNHQIFQIWEMVNAGYIPVGEYYYGRLVNVNKDSMAILREYVLSGQNKCVCINDNDFLTDRTFELMKPKVLDLLEEKYPDKSSFEK